MNEHRRRTSVKATPSDCFDQASMTWRATENQTALASATIA
jgi:hypothetical protein